MIRNANKKKAKICEADLCQARRFPQSIMAIYGQGKQRSMAQIWPQRLSDFYSCLVSGRKKSAAKQLSSMAASAVRTISKEPCKRRGKATEPMLRARRAPIQLSGRFLANRHQKLSFPVSWADPFWQYDSTGSALCQRFPLTPDTGPRRPARSFPPACPPPGSSISASRSSPARRPGRWPCPVRCRPRRC